MEALILFLETVTFTLELQIDLKNTGSLFFLYLPLKLDEDNLS